MFKRIDNKTWDIFVYNGTITERIISKIATTIKSGKTMSIREIAIYREHARLIEQKLKEQA